MGSNGTCVPVTGFSLGLQAAEQMSSGLYSTYILVRDLVPFAIIFFQMHVEIYLVPR